MNSPFTVVKLFDFDDMPEDVRINFDLYSVWYKGNIIGKFVKDEFSDSYKILDNWLIENGAKEDEFVVIQY